ncbi:nitrous oxide reductase family maturation protein NosD [Bacillus sp. ISL-35]|uniref:nitrous oxide reductase family maturation protein NosD n=1 Tax=Bacillus sp. ISL-35 TaxID=2819122 RepID=UPI001BEBE06E|nr:nitrous oxide reductase family maturation protein NosD [Bacillus sp. ISL-35]MBT2679746.1 nitrous oxide reductase family maturation protein NosD [Bacillus sp. ISL-35]MBT2704780.1 nitrous oxide reductase family maturation protein NosD [Chryseobacterium sp. ISL-80]
MHRLPWPIWFIIFLLLWLVPDAASAKDLKVEDGLSIQSAIDQAEAGDTLTIFPGTYKENIVINKRMTLIGEQGAIIDGGGKGNVIEIAAPGVTVKGLMIQNCGSGQEDSGIFIQKADGNIIENNILKDVHNGIYITNSRDNQVLENSITSYESHFSKRGNGIHMFKGGGHLLKKNEIAAVQDGIYYDFTEHIKVTGNHVSESRYGMHFMFSEDISAERNHIEKNVTGFMVMDSANITFLENRVTDHFHVRGFGILIYETRNVLVERNEMLRNSTGLSLENGVNLSINKNLIGANQVGLEFVGENKENLFAENNFIGNVVQSKISGEDMRLDDGLKGNYWDDYSSFDLSGDGIGEEAYKAGSLYDRILRKQPYWQFFFESPSVKLWTKAESLFPSFGSAEVYDARPLIEPAEIQPSAAQQNRDHWRSGVIGIVFIVISLFAIVKGRNFR